VSESKDDYYLAMVSKIGCLWVLELSDCVHTAHMKLEHEQLTGSKAWVRLAKVKVEEIR
jgi:hypothetical protein